MFWDKKGDFKYETLAKIILVLIIGVIIIYATNIIVSGSGKGADIAACKAWTVFQSSIKDPVLGVPLKNFQNPCVTFKDTIKGNKLKIYKTLADTMHDTWKMYGEGKVDFFTDRGLGSTSCFIGDEIKIGKTDLKENKIDIDDFEKWLSHNFPPNADYTYSEYFLGTKDTEIDFGSGEFEMNEDEKLYTVFIVEKRYPSTIEGKLEVLGNGLWKTGSLLLFGGAKIGTATTLTRAPVGGMTVAGKIYKGGQFMPKTTVKGVNLITIGLLVAGTFSYALSDQSVMIPSIAILEGKDVIEQSCDSVHYNPKKNLLEGFSGGDGGITLENE
jgi:hypothetical protein